MSNIDIWAIFVNMPSMSDIKIDIMTAAMRVFARYGLKKTTMKDIADEAGVARQTVYNAFPGKDALLCDLIRYAGVQIETQTRADWQGVTSLETRLQIFFDHALIQPYRTIHASPEVETLEESLSAAGHQAMAEVDQVKHVLLSDLFADQGAALARHGLSVEQMVEWVRVTCVGHKAMAKDEAQLVRLLDILAKVVMTFCEDTAA